MSSADTASDALARLHERWRSLARSAFAQGQEAAGVGDLAAAERWLGRAARLVPEDDTVALMLAGIALRRGRTDCVGVFARLAETHDLAEAWLGLAEARHRRGDASGAATALANALSRHVWREKAGREKAGRGDTVLAALADAIAAASGAPGWCGLRADGNPVLGPAGIAAAVTVTLDGRALPAGKALPVIWRKARALSVRRGDTPLLGSPIDLGSLRRIEGVVADRDGGIEGWAWHPADPDADPLLHIEPARGGARLTVIAADAAMDVPSGRPLARPRRFLVPARRLAAFPGLLHVLAPDGRDLPGSPLDPRGEITAAATLAGTVASRWPATGRRKKSPPAPNFAPMPVAAPGSAVPATASRARPRGISVVMPVHGNPRQTLACLDQLLATLPDHAEAIIVDDASPEPELTAALDALARARRIRLLRQARNRGFPASANAGMRAAAGRDVVLLNSDALVPACWLAHLTAAACAAPDIGTATPFSNDATILSYPDVAGGNPVPDRAATEQLQALAARANAGMRIEIPTAIGFCMYIRRDCLDAVGLFREDVFAQGYGEENDFCLRARHLGWRHVAAADCFVAHIGGGSFGAARTPLQARNLALLNRLHPGYDALIGDFIARDPLAEARRRLDIARWRAARTRPVRPAVLLVTHDRGGGVERQVMARAASLREAGSRSILLRPVLEEPAHHYAGLVRIADREAGAFPNLRFRLPAELPALARLLAAERPEAAEIHHLLGHDHAILDLPRRLGIPYDIHIHDYAWLCPRIALVGAERRYCGEPDVAACVSCVADAGHNLEEDIDAATLRARSAGDLGGARCVVAPSADTARRIHRHFPRLRPEIVPWEPDDPPPIRAPLPARAASRVAVLGAIGIEKGYDVLLACARDAARRGLKLDFVVIGHSIDDARLLDTGRVFVTGTYREGEAAALIEAEQAGLGFIPSIWPETWCFTLSEAWRAGLFVVAFDIGAPAERIRSKGHGAVLPLGLPPTAVNDALLATYAQRAARFTPTEPPVISRHEHRPYAARNT